MYRRLALFLAAATVTGGALAVSLLAPSVAATAAAPHIAAHPHSVMVNHATQLVGRHFTPKKAIVLEECSQTSWVVTQSPCDTTNTVKVKPNAKGQFTTPFTVHTCFQGAEPPGFSQTCYIGDPTPSGVDTMTLVGAATITVTGP